MIELRVRHALPGFTLALDEQLPARGITALFGHSGAGKTTLVNSVAGASRPAEARIVLDGETIVDTARNIWLPPERRGIGYVFQDARLFPHLSVRGNLRYGLKRARGPLRIGEDEIVALLGIGHLLDRRPHNLSGGERQRVGLGRALLAQPRWLLLDEPLAALDPARKSELLPYIETLRDAFGLPMLYISHAIDEVIRLADHLLVLDQGRVVASGPLLDIISVPALSPHIGRFEAGAVIACTVVAHDAARGVTRLAFTGGELSVQQGGMPVGAALRVRIRARDVALALSEPLDTSITNRLPGRVSALLAREGGYVDASVDVGGTLIRALVTADSAQRLGLEVGKPVWALLKSVAMDSRVVGFSRRPRTSV